MNCPVTIEEDEAQWMDRDLVYDDFAQIRECVDDCLTPSQAPKSKGMELTFP